MAITMKEIIERAKERFEKYIAEMSDVTALMFPMVFEQWEPGKEYTAGVRVRHNDVLYRVMADHVAEEGMEPDVAMDKFEKVVVEATEE